MTTAQYHCPLCSALFEVDASLAGCQVTCPTCSGVVTLPEAETSGETADFSDASAAAETSMLQLGCPICAGEFQVTLDMQGQQVVCPHCSNAVTIPDAPVASPEPTLSGDSGPTRRQSSGGRTPASSADHRSKSRATGGEKDDVARSRPDSTIGKHPDPARAPQRDAKSSTTPPSKPISPSGKSPTESAADANAFPPVRKTSSDRSADLSAPPRPRREEHRTELGKPNGAKTDVQETKRTPQRSTPREPTAENRSRVPNRPEPIAPGSASSGAAGRSPTDGVEPLLPPSLRSEIGVAPGDRAALPKVDATTMAPAGSIVIPTEHGLAAVRDPVKTVQTSSGEVELRRLSPEEKARRRRQRMLFLWIVGGLLLLATVMILLYSGPVKTAPPSSTGEVPADREDFFCIENLIV